MSIPWRTDDDWREANRLYDLLIRRYRSRMRPLFDRAILLQQELETLFFYLDAACHRTCRYCPDPCCCNATIWYDFADLLFLHLIGEAPPDGQPVASIEQSCRYLSAKGCRLPRIKRPWICTRYICGTQRAAFGNMDKEVKAECEQVIGNIKSQRFAMEADFIDITS